jgi:two-component system invasion response regulator UvrY
VTGELLTRLDTRTVLVCDDRQELRDAIGDLLMQLPAFRVVGYAVDGTTCLAGVRTWMPAILVLDVNMPGGGPEVARAAKAICTSLHIVVFSGQSGEDVRHGMLAAGADQYVIKTGRLSPLIQALHRASGDARGHR